MPIIPMMYCINFDGKANYKANNFPCKIKMDVHDNKLIIFLLPKDVLCQV